VVHDSDQENMGHLIFIFSRKSLPGILMG
jgi:hypothetical protein